MLGFVNPTFIYKFRPTFIYVTPRMETGLKSRQICLDFRPVLTLGPT